MVDDTLHQIVTKGKSDGGERCQCNLCVRGRDFKQLISGIEERTRTELESFYELLYETEAELECQKIYMQNLKELNPEMYKKCNTIQTLKIEDNL
jgi:hypothetical protein